MFDVLNFPIVVAIFTLLGSLLCSLLFLLYRIEKQRKLQQQTLSIQEVQRLWGDKSFQKGIAIVKLIGKEDIAQYAKDRKNHLDKNSEERKKWVRKKAIILRTINYFETISVGIHVGIYDSDIIKRISKTMILEFYDKTEPFIKEIRKQYPQSAIEFEKYAKRLKKSQTISFLH